MSLKWSFLNYQDSNHSYYVNAEFQTADNLLPIDEYVIGGDSGLRGNGMVRIAPASVPTVAAGPAPSR